VVPALRRLFMSLLRIILAGAGAVALTSCAAAEGTPKGASSRIVQGLAPAGTTSVLIVDAEGLSFRATPDAAGQFSVAIDSTRPVSLFVVGSSTRVLRVAARPGAPAADTVLPNWQGTVDTAQLSTCDCDADGTDDDDSVVAEQNPLAEIDTDEDGDADLDDDDDDNDGIADDDDDDCDGSGRNDDDEAHDEDRDGSPDACDDDDDDDGTPDDEDSDHNDEDDDGVDDDEDQDRDGDGEDDDGDDGEDDGDGDGDDDDDSAPGPG
jgi:hypothetical protein